ncbi:hypothetical protein R6Q59_028077 [Mikania micrantha]
MEKAPIIDVVIVVNDEEEKAYANENYRKTRKHEELPHSLKEKKRHQMLGYFCTVINDDGSEVPQCMHCGEKINKLKDGTTTPLHRHIDMSCPKLKAANKGQLNLKIGQVNSTVSSSFLQNWKFSNARMREVISHMIKVHELPFNFVEYDLFNVMMKDANPAFNKISRATARQDCISSFENGKKRIQKLLNNVNCVSITTDMWTSVQNIHYMVLTCTFVDSDFNLHKYILSFVNVPPPYSGVRIYDSLFKCLKDWNIETKVATLTVDNASTNDVVARKLMENLNLQKKLVIMDLFHVRCCAHILNLLVQDGLSEFKDIVHNVRESVKHVGASPGRLHIFTEHTRQLKLPKKHLILDVSTRWNATYAMLSTAVDRDGKKTRARRVYPKPATYGTDIPKPDGVLGRVWD